MRKTYYILFILIIIMLGIFLYLWFYDIQYFPTPKLFLESKIVSFTNDYDINTFNCQNFSQELFDRLDKDYNVFYVGGLIDDNKYIIVKTSKENIPTIITKNTYENNYEAHEWIYVVDYNIYIESTSGTVINKEKMRDYNG